MNALTRPNKFPGKCQLCGAYHAAGAAIILKTDMGWKVQCAAACPPKAVEAPKPVNVAVGDLAGIMALFDMDRDRRGRALGLALARQCKDHYANASAKKGEQ